MERLMSHITTIPEDGGISYETLLKWIDEARDTPDIELMKENVYKQILMHLSGEGTIDYMSAVDILDKLVNGFAESFYERTQMKTQMSTMMRNNGVNSENAAELQLVPDTIAKPRLGIQPTGLDARRRAHTPLSRKNPMTSTAEGIKLRNRNMAAMTNEEYDARANTVQPQLLDSLTSYAEKVGLNPQRKTNDRMAVETNGFSYTTAAGDKQEYSDHQFVSDTEFGGISTPYVDRKVLRQHMRNKSRTPPTGSPSHRVVPASPSSPLHDMNHHVPDALSPSHYSARDNETQKYINGLLTENKEQKRIISDKNRRLELSESQNEKRVLKLERDLDECKGELTTRKREMDRLKSSERNYLESLNLAESEIERLGTDLSNMAAQSADVKRKLETKTSLVEEANSRMLEQQTEIMKLKSNLNANYQQHEQLAKEHRRLEMQLRELQHELESARECQDEASTAHKENMRLNETIEGLERELGDLRLQTQRLSTTDGNNDSTSAGLVHRKTYRKYMSLQDELVQNGGEDMSGVDDLVALDKDTAGSTHVLEKAGLLVKGTKDVSIGTTNSDAQELKDDAVRQWMSAALNRCSSEDLVLLYEVWKRIEYCDVSNENQENLKRELVSVFTAPYKYGLKDAIRSRANATLTRIVDNVSGDCLNAHLASAGHHQFSGNNSKSAASGLANALANSQHTTAAVILYSVVVFCLGIITASYFNLAQPLSTSLPFGMANGTIASAVRDTGDGTMGLVRQILVVDDTPVTKYYPPLRKRAPRSRFGEILFYWMETLLWEDGDAQIPT
ncbi:hypothetical protein IW140_001257 [Coemansia sp. RSA 1813]|nr:hypothetical protein EV178_001153 [Coemansia sp. RSA 1646]KAJ1771741.1 hypothetical protein LPJ74_002043 [Coemansia sp. RSA 1843]KAJ2091693.1 hypothetical protein IW138_001676 [Coemansia sp. RSA 986]KAJ2216904.1 hypothetical protein EV179_000938 [Coemansia sp. RSA 487]KAJ2571908.1 hypothetical protein IW140_001257 [Coemansia sp. RSA 1813]